MRYFILSLLSITVIGLSASPSAFIIPRAWENREGNQIQATLLSYQGGSLILKKNDGFIFSISLTSLSDKDQGYMESLINSSLIGGYILDRYIDVEYKVAKKYTSGGDLVESGKKTSLGFKEKIRTPLVHYAILQGMTSKNGYLYVLSERTFRQLRELQTININNLQSHGFLEHNRITTDDSPINIAGAVVLRANYGADGRYNDATTIIQKAINNGESSIQVGNHTMGGDPVFGKTKKLEITIVTSLGTIQQTIREGDTLYLR